MKNALIQEGSTYAEKAAAGLPFLVVGRSSGVVCAFKRRPPGAFREMVPHLCAGRVIFVGSEKEQDD